MKQRKRLRRAHHIIKKTIYEAPDVKLDEGFGEDEGTNTVLLPSRSAAKTIYRSIPKSIPKLSKKKRKKLENVLKRKQKLAKRKELVDAVINSSENIPSLKSISQLGCKPKKLRKPKEILEISAELSSEDDMSISEARDPVNSDDVEVDQDVNESATHQMLDASKDNVDPVIQSTPKIINVLKSDLVLIERDDDLQKYRMALPIMSEEHVILDAINSSSTVIITGSTGCGKSTQLPQILYESGYHNIVISEPRRIAAMALAKRVSFEMPSLPNGTVAYQVRHDGNVAENTHIRFVTDGVLMRYVQSDFLLSKYSAVVIDEAHERTLYSDVLIGLLSRIIRLRLKRNKPLKLIIMSATLNVDDFKGAHLFGDSSPPVVNIPSRQYPVSVHFLKTTPIDYVSASCVKVSQIHNTLPYGGILVFLTGVDEIKTVIHALQEKFPWKNDASHNLYVLPLYSQLDTKLQNRIFERPPDNSRLCVISTNVAETSLTIPGIRYVVDCGRSKRRVFDRVTGLSTYVVDWISQSNASQRAGRAGREGPGHCYRLFSSSCYSDMSEHLPTEISQLPIEGLVLQLKYLNVANVVNFPFVTKPDIVDLQTAENSLVLLGALDHKKLITDLGKVMANLPVAPRFAKLLALSDQGDLTNYIVGLVSGLAAGATLWTDNKYKTFWAKTDTQLLGDFMVILRAVCAVQAVHKADESVWCLNHGLRLAAVREIKSLQAQLRASLQCKEVGELHPPSPGQVVLMRQLLLASAEERIARLAEDDAVKSSQKGVYRCLNIDGDVYIHPDSVFANKRPFPEFIAYNELIEAGSGRVYMKDVWIIESSWLAICIPSLTQFSEPLLDPHPFYDEKSDEVKCYMKANFGRRSWCLPIASYQFPDVKMAYQVFAVAFLSGNVIAHCFHEWSSKLLSHPLTMIRTWSHLQPRTITFLNALLSRKVRSLQTLKVTWKDNPTFLLREYLEWIPNDLSNQVTSKWSSIQKYCFENT